MRVVWTLWWWTQSSVALLSVVSDVNNDVWSLLKGVPDTKRYDTVSSGFNNTVKGGGILVLASHNPLIPTTVTSTDWQMARDKSLAVYLEMPAALPGLKVDKPSVASYVHRLVAPGTGLAQAGIDPLTILNANEPYFVGAWNGTTPCCLPSSLLVFDKVAGVDEAIFGVDPPALLNPVLFPVKDPTLPKTCLVATVKLSQLVTAQYRPVMKWHRVWQFILDTVTTGLTMPVIPQTVKPMYGPSESLPPTAGKTAVLRSAAWLQSKSTLLLRGGDPRCPAPYAKNPHNVTCMLEGWGSEIYWNGTQKLAGDIRMDCNAESAMGLVVAATLMGNDGKVAESDATGLLDYIYFQSVAQQGPRGDPKSPAYGLVAWGTSSPAWINAFYGDDNARVLLGSLTAAAGLQKSNWDDSILRAVFANLRTSSDQGFRPGRINLPDILKLGWRHYFDSGYTYHNTSSPQPHYQSYLWAVYLRFYDLTKVELLYTHASNGLRATMEAYIASPSSWVWTEYLSEEFSHLLLPLAWLYRVRPTGDHRAWLNLAADAYLNTQQPCGCIREFLGSKGHSSTGPPSSNSRYGTGEAPLIQTDEDTIVDLLYSNNFALVGLQEISAATNDPRYAKAADALGDCLVRIQAHSTGDSVMDGAWYRGFDYKKWEYWGSASDWGWGPWSVETGWTEGWIATGLAMRELKTTLWSYTAASTIDEAKGRTVCAQLLDTAHCGGTSS